MAIQNNKDWQTGENPGKSINTAKRKTAQVLQIVELYWITPKNASSVWLEVTLNVNTHR